MGTWVDNPTYEGLSPCITGPGAHLGSTPTRIPWVVLVVALGPTAVQISGGFHYAGIPGEILLMEDILHQLIGNLYIYICTLLKTNIAPKKRWFPIGISFSRGLFSGAISHSFHTVASWHPRWLFGSCSINSLNKKRCFQIFKGNSPLIARMTHGEIPFSSGLAGPSAEKIPSIGRNGHVKSCKKFTTSMFFFPTRAKPLANWKIHCAQSPVWFVIGSLLTFYIYPCGPQDHYMFRLGHSELNLHLFLLPGGGPYRMYPYHPSMTPRVFDHQCCWPHSWRVARLRLNTSWEPSPSRFLQAVAWTWHSCQTLSPKDPGMSRRKGIITLQSYSLDGIETMNLTLGRGILLETGGLPRLSTFPKNACGQERILTSHNWSLKNNQFPIHVM